MDFSDLPQVKYTETLLENGRCLIDGDKYPLVIGKIVEMLRTGTQPRILILGDPGHGTTWCAGWISEILHEEIGVLTGSFEPEEQIFGDPLDFSESVREENKKILVVPDADSMFPSDEYNSAKNRNNRDLMYLSRIMNNILCYDAHEMFKCDKAIRTNHNIRIVSLGPGDTYKFKAKRIKRENDTQIEQIDQKDLGVFKAKKPSKDTRERIKELDESEKEKNIKENEEEIKLKRKKQALKSKAFG